MSLEWSMCKSGVEWPIGIGPLTLANEGATRVEGILNQKSQV